MFGALALIIAAIGVYGLEVYEVARRTQSSGFAWRLAPRQGDIRPAGPAPGNQDGSGRPFAQTPARGWHRPGRQQRAVPR